MFHPAARRQTLVVEHAQVPANPGIQSESQRDIMKRREHRPDLRIGDGF